MKILDLQQTTPVENPVSSVSMGRISPATYYLYVGGLVFLSESTGPFFDSTAQSSRTIEILKERYALGEIDEEEYSKNIRCLSRRILRKDWMK